YGLCPRTSRRSLAGRDAAAPGPGVVACPGRLGPSETVAISWRLRAGCVNPLRFWRPHRLRPGLDCLVAVGGPDCTRRCPRPGPARPGGRHYRAMVGLGRVFSRNFDLLGTGRLELFLLATRDSVGGGVAH